MALRSVTLIAVWLREWWAQFWLKTSFRLPAEFSNHIVFKYLLEDFNIRKFYAVQAMTCTKAKYDFIFRIILRSFHIQLTVCTCCLFCLDSFFTYSKCVFANALTTQLKHHVLLFYRFREMYVILSIPSYVIVLLSFTLQSAVNSLKPHFPFRIPVLFWLSSLFRRF